MLLDLSPLKTSRDYRLLFFGQLVSFFGSMMTFIVVPWQMYPADADRRRWSGTLHLAEFVPMFCLAFVGGALADYVDKRKLLRLTEIGQTVLTAILVDQLAAAEPADLDTLRCRRIHAGLAALQRPAFESFIQKVIPAEMMSAVMALNSIRFTLGMILGPSIAGIIATQFSPAAAYTIDLVTFAASLIAVFMIRFVPPPENAERPSLDGVRKGIKYAFSRQELVGTYFIDIAAMFFAFPQAFFFSCALYFVQRVCCWR